VLAGTRRERLLRGPAAPLVTGTSAVTLSERARESVSLSVGVQTLFAGGRDGHGGCSSCVRVPAGNSMTAVVRLAVAAFALVLAPVLVALTVVDYGHSAWGLAFLGFLLVGALILWRQPDNLIGWLLFVVGASTSVLVVDQWYVRSSLGPGPVAAEVVLLPLGSLPWIALILLVVLFPDGRANTRLQSSLVRLVVLVGTVGLLGALTQPDGLTSKRPNPLAADWIAPIASWLINGPGFIIIPALLLAALTSLILRWRSSAGDRRLQFRWLLWGATITLLALPGMFVFSGDVWSVVGVTLLLAFWAIPVAIGVAVTKYRLYDIDRLISRTTSYAIVTGLLVTTYLAVAASLSTVLGQQSSLAVAAATLTAAALARPVLRRVQDAVDRRFNRSRYDAMHTVDAFGTRLRNQVDPHHVSQDLVAVVTTTLQPDQVTVWIRQPT